MDDFNNAHNFQSPTPTPSPVQNTPAPTKSNGFSVTALIMGICSLVFVCCGGGLVLGSLGIIFALLSRGSESMDTQAKVGLGLSIGGFAFSIIVLIGLLAYGDLQRGVAEYYDRYYYEYGYDWNYDYEDWFDRYENDFEFPDFDNNLGDT